MGQKLGQHFLISDHVLQKIAQAVEIKNGDFIIEVGPGHGELTHKILEGEVDIKLVLVEKDPEFVRLLESKFADDARVKVLTHDARKFFTDKNISLLTRGKKYKVVGNIPYYLTGYLLRLLGDLDHQPNITVLTIQKEVGERIAAEAPYLNKLAASVRFWAKSEFLFGISRKDFSPIPKVDSATIKLQQRKLSPRERLFKKQYFKLISIIFAQPRKTILNNLVSGTKKSREEIFLLLNKKSISPELRPQNLTSSQIFELAKVFFGEAQE